jgi:hypothetical protein
MGSADDVEAGTGGAAAAGGVGASVGGTGGAAGVEHENCSSARCTRSSTHDMRGRLMTTPIRFMAEMRCKSLCPVPVGGAAPPKASARTLEPKGTLGPERFRREASSVFAGFGMDDFECRVASTMAQRPDPASRDDAVALPEASTPATRYAAQASAHSTTSTARSVRRSRRGCRTRSTPPWRPPRSARAAPSSAGSRACFGRAESACRRGRVGRPRVCSS